MPTGNPGGYAPLPVGSPGGYPAAPGYGYPGGLMTNPPPSSGAAIASLICGILSIFGTFFIFLGLPLTLAAIICGHIGRANIRKSGGRLSGDGAALTGLILGYLLLVVDIAVVGFIIVAAVYVAKHPDQFVSPSPTPDGF